MMKFELQTIYLDEPIVQGRALDIFYPAEITRKSAIFFVHGGGWHAGNRTDYHPIMEELCGRGFVCATTDYRLARPGITPVDQITDIRLAYEKFVIELEKRGIPTRIAVFGTSAGAHLASLLLCAEPGEVGEENQLTRSWVKPECGLLQATPAQYRPWIGAFPHIYNTMERVAGAAYEENPDIYERLSLDRYIRPGNPRLFFMEAQYEHDFPSKMNYALVEKHWKYKINSWFKVYADAEHGFFYATTRTCQREAFEDFIRFTEE